MTYDCTSKKVTEAREFNEQTLMSLLIIADREARFRNIKE